MNKFIAALLVFTFVTCAVVTAPAAQKTATSKPQVYTGEIWDESCAKQGTHENMAGENSIPSGPKMARECTQECHDMGSPLVLYNPANKHFYVLDDQAKAEKFAGEKVKVIGTLDKRTNSIHVASIAAN